MALSQQLLDMLVCPQCKGDLELAPAQDSLTCHTCKLRYPVEDDIPIMLIEEAAPLG